MEKVKLNRALLSLGSNLGDRKQHIETAIELIKQRVGEIEFVSSYYESEPWGFDSLNQFVNVCLTCTTMLTPFELLQKLKKIEQDMGRTKTKATYEDRFIDLDIIFFNNENIHTQELTVPHPYYESREFVIIPLKEIIKEGHPFYHFIKS